MAFSRGHRIRTAAFIAAFLLFIPLTFYFSRHLWLPLIAHALVSEQKPPKGEGWIVVLMGDPTLERAKAALKAYQEGNGQRLIFSPIKDDPLFLGTGCETQADRTQRFFTEQGIDPTHIQVTDCSVTSTQDEAACIAKLLQTKEAPPFLVGVTSWYHTSRSAWLFKKTLGKNSPPLYWVAAPTHEGSARNWWRYESTFISVFAEYVKWIYWRMGLDASSDHVRS